jgi:hypothetical protein
MIINYIGLHVKYPLFLFHFNKTWNFLSDFRKILNIKFHKNPSSESVLFHADERTDVTKLFAILRTRLKTSDVNDTRLHQIHNSRADTHIALSEKYDLSIWRTKWNVNRCTAKVQTGITGRNCHYLAKRTTARLIFRCFCCTKGWWFSPSSNIYRLPWPLDPLARSMTADCPRCCQACSKFPDQYCWRRSCRQRAAQA